ncbi:MAG: hypothetical protein Alpg2KO_23420 [Alphaproteobacteria bacterium]
MPLFLYKANDDGISHCTCAPADAVAMSPGQMDCPWCGCGWLISCRNCNKSFTFAVVRETDESLIELGRKEVEARGISDSVTEEEIADWAEAMAADINRFEPGQIVVYLDGHYWPVDTVDIEFDGYFARHHLQRLPHILAAIDPALIDRLLGDKDYWMKRQLQDPDAS